MKHFLKLMDWSKEEILEVLDLADELKYKKKNGIPHELLKGKTLGLIFQKSSTSPGNALPRKNWKTALSPADLLTHRYQPSPIKWSKQ